MTAPVCRFLSHQFFAVMAKLTYGAYLVHPIFMVVTDASIPSLPYFSSMYLVVKFCGYVVLAYAAAFILYLLVEKPMEKVCALLTPFLTPPSAALKAKEDPSTNETQLSSFKKYRREEGSRIEYKELK